MAEFFHMGGYGAYVWPGFIVAFLVMTGMALQSWADLRQQKRKIKELEALKERA